MKIVVPTDGKKVAQHFGHCPSFTFFDVDDNKITDEETVVNPGHKPGFLPNFLGDKGATVIIAGGMGGGAVDIFNERKIEVVMGASGDAKAAVESYLAGNLKSSGSICHDHAFHDENCDH
ncbi:MAG: NifB/NifX family molybdenum-iron cluster-binding protein [Treponema sp.]|jgi:predicted Fe-Mo cluster-binding NifX family protein|nr:NifB/NifX family molybdenum-iron cluster-binding protein [Treponema sp.]